MFFFIILINVKKNMSNDNKAIKENLFQINNSNKINLFDFFKANVKVKNKFIESSF